MKKLAVLALLVTLGLNPSQAKTTSVERVLQRQKRSVLMNQTLMKNAVARATPRTQRKLLAIDDSDDPAGPDELTLQTLYRRPQITQSTEYDDVSNYVMVRLAVARARAMKAYRQKWT